jgi:hypothetical protein
VGVSCVAFCRETQISRSTQINFHFRHVPMKNTAHVLLVTLNQQRILPENFASGFKCLFFLLLLHGVSSIDARFICVHNVLSFFDELHSDEVLMVPRYNTSFNHNGFASFHLMNNVEFFQKKLVDPLKFGSAGVIIYFHKGRIVVSG